MKLASSNLRRSHSSLARPRARFDIPGLFLVIAALLTSGCVDAVIDGAGCKYNGKTYPILERFAATDGCNTCACDETGAVSCTEIACVHDAGSGAGAHDASSSVHDAGNSGGRDAGPGGGGRDAGSSAGTCSYGDKLYKYGESFTDSDGCNTCSCSAEGVFCTLLACIQTCKEGDKTYFPGQSFPSSDGCNTCSCSADGNIGCTKIGCASKTCDFNGKTYQVGDSFRDALDCNACVCTAQGVVCTARFCDPAEFCKLGAYSFASGASVLCEDGCNECLCVGGSFSSTDRACPPLPKVERCSDATSAGAKARVLYLSGDALALEVGMGGCANSQPAFKLCFDGAFLESFPVMARLTIVPTELTVCSAWSTQRKVFDLKPLRDAYNAAYQTSTGKFQVGLPGDGVLYAF